MYIRNQGDTWLFWILMDRIPIAIWIVLIYFGFQVTHWSMGLLFFGGMAGPLVATMPHRPRCGHRAELSLTCLLPGSIGRVAGEGLVDR